MATLLIIDDAPEMGLMLKELTSLLGHSSHFICGGVEGVAGVMKIKPDVVLLDVMMPEMNGWETYKGIRAISNVPVVFITTDSTAENRAKARRLGATMVSKDIRPKKLQETIVGML